MNMDSLKPTADQDPGALRERLTAMDTPLEERIAITRQLFPEERKREILAHADTDSKGRSVRYFRLMSYKELQGILAGEDVNGIHNPVNQESFNRQSEEIKHALQEFLKHEGIFERFQHEFEALAGDFTFERYRDFALGVLPRQYLYRLHFSPHGGGGDFIGVTGLSSLSVGAPYKPPADPSGERLSHREEGLPVIEMSIPADDVHVNPFGGASKEMEKEVNTTTIKPEWITDIYNGRSDFAERFVKDPGSVLYQGYQSRIAAGEIYKGASDDESMVYVGGNDVWDILTDWKLKETISEVIPAKLAEDMNPHNPKFQKPLRAG